MHFQIETGLIFGSSALVENNQKHSSKFWKLSQVNNKHENSREYISSHPVDIRTLSEPLLKKIDEYSIKP